MKSLNQSKILVIGGAGFIGSNLCEHLVQNYTPHVKSLDNYSTGSITNHISGITYIEGHSHQISKLANENFDFVFHLGEYARVEKSFSEIEKVWDFNIRGTFSVIQFCLANRSKLIYAGSSTKFETGQKGKDHSPYAWTKSTNTDLIVNFGNWYNLNHAIVYFYNVYGTNEIQTGPYATLIGRFKHLKRMGRALTVVKPGTQRRNFTHVSDIVSGLVTVAERGEGDGYGIGSSEKFSVLEVASMFGGPVDYLPERAGNRMDAELITDKTHQLGWQPKIKLQAHIESFLESL